MRRKLSALSVKLHISVFQLLCLLLLLDSILSQVEHEACEGHNETARRLCETDPLYLPSSSQNNLSTPSPRCVELALTHEIEMIAKHFEIKETRDKDIF